jgi:riboflavin synthase
MFTGIVRTCGKLLERESRGAGARLRLDSGGLDTTALEPGASIAVNGCCLTVTEPFARGFHADASGETLDKTTLGALAIDSELNIEPALAAGDPLGGHLMSGHIDGIGEVLEVRSDGEMRRLRFAAPQALAPMIAAKGSIAVDGVSLTVNEVEGNEFGVAIIPATLERTILRAYAPGTRVNLEVDIVARYLARLLATKGQGVWGG